MYKWDEKGRINCLSIPLLSRSCRQEKWLLSDIRQRESTSHNIITGTIIITVSIDTTGGSLYSDNKTGEYPDEVISLQGENHQEKRERGCCSLWYRKMRQRNSHHHRCVRENLDPKNGRIVHSFVCHVTHDTHGRLHNKSNDKQHHFKSIIQSSNIKTPLMAIDNACPLEIWTGHSAQSRVNKLHMKWKREVFSRHKKRHEIVSKNHKSIRQHEESDSSGR